MTTGLHALLVQWHNEADTLMHSVGYDNHSRGILITMHIRQVMNALGISPSSQNE